MGLYTLHLFAGAGGGILADALHGFIPVGAVEIEQFQRHVLLARQADGSLPRFPIWNDVRTFRINNPDTRAYIERLRGIRDRLCISGGFPCQDISCAGKKAGITGRRSGLWKEFARIIGEIQPRYVFVENSNCIVRRGLDVVLSDFTQLGYNVAWGTLPAQAVGAYHKRNRFWGLAISDAYLPRSGRSEGEKALEGNEHNIPDCLRDRNGQNGSEKEVERSQREISDAGYDRSWQRERWIQENSQAGYPERGKETVAIRQRQRNEPRLGRMANGISHWLDEVKRGLFWTPEEKGLPRIANCTLNKNKRMAAIGNGQVPLCAAVAFELLYMELERWQRNEN